MRDNPFEADTSLLTPVTDVEKQQDGFIRDLRAPTASDNGAMAGVTFYEAAVQLKQGLDNGDLLNIASGFAAASLDLLAVGSDPIGYVAGQLMSWMLEHVEPMREVLDGLAGNPPMIAAYSQAWADISTEVAAVQAELGAKVESGTGSWVGEAGNAYRAHAADVGNLLGAAGQAAQAISTLAEQVGHLVAGIRTAVRDILSGLAGALVSYAIEEACSLGAATPVVVAQATARIAWAMGKVAQLVKYMDDIVKFSLTWIVALRDILDGVFKSAAVE